MGFWHTGYMEFHEPTGDTWGPRKPHVPEFACPDCGLVFSTQRDQRAHRFDGHSTRRPMLVFRGRECGRTRLTITSPSIPADWRVADVQTISLNGRTSTVDATAEFLAHQKLGVHTVTLVNGPLERTFEFDFNLAADEHLQLVDHALERLIAGRELSLSTIEAFIMQAKSGETARRYREGLAHYLYGLLAREGLANHASTDSSGNRIYEQRYNRAVDLLGSFDRPPAEAICGLVALHYNQFDLAVRKTNSHRVSDVAARLNAMVSGLPFVSESLIDRTHGSFDQALSDSVTEELITVSAIALDGSGLGPLTDALAALKDLRPADQFKVRLIASEALLASGDIEGARLHSEALRNYRDTDAWYASFRARLQEVGR